MRTIGTIYIAELDKDITLRATKYADGRPAILMEDVIGTPYGALSVNIPSVKLEAGELLIKTWSENELYREPALASGYFVDTGKRVTTGFVQAEVWRLIR